MLKIDDLYNARCKLLQELRKPTRIEMSKKNIKAIMIQCDLLPDEEWDPEDGEQTGTLYAIPVFVNNAIKDGFIMSGV